MKQGTQFVLPVEIGMSLDEISRIEFVFKQKIIMASRLLNPTSGRMTAPGKRGRTSSLSPGRGKKRTNSWAAKHCTWTPASRYGTALTSRRRRFWRSK